MSSGETNIQFNETARETDRALAEIDGEIDWLTRLTPVNLDAVRVGFEESGWREMPALEYAELPAGFERLRDRLLALPVRGFGNSDIEALLIEKQRELDRQIELVRLRGRTGFTMAAIDLFGDVDPVLLQAAETVLANVPLRDAPPSRDVDAQGFMAAARGEMETYRARDDRFAFEVIEEPTPGTHIFTSGGNLHVAVDYRVPEERVDPLIQHEVGTHTITRFNGRCQPLDTLECGLADYDALQEGIAVLAEYMAGHLPPSRLRVLAARVVAARMAIDEQPAGEIFATVHEQHDLDIETAFNTTMRALRGGGMTKDALYLDGLIDLLAYMKGGGDVPLLFIGKFALKQRAVLERLLEAGFLHPPALNPNWVDRPGAGEELAAIAELEIDRFYKETSA